MTPDPLSADSAIDLVDRILSHAKEIGASDVHLVPTEAGLQVTLRRDGTLVPVGTLAPECMATVVGRFKVLANLLVYRTDIPQEGRISRDRSGIDSEVRIATYPTLMGEKVAVRLDARRGESLGLDNLGLSTEVRDALIEAIEQPEGVILLTGPAGSGKTTTLYSCLNYLVGCDRPRNIVSVEDPIERRIEGVVQTEVNETVGLSYGVALQSILRQDPEVILIGEIRDKVTAACVMEAGLTGHLIASTIHAGSAPQVYARLMEMGIEPFAMTSVVRGVLSQRLLRRRCAAAPGDPGDHGDCTVCHGEGYAGRVLLAEWLPMSAPLREAILSRRDCEGLTAAARPPGYRDLATAARSMVQEGITTEEEVYRVLGYRMQHEPEAVPRDGILRRPRLVAPDPGGDVPGERAAAQGTPVVIPRPDSPEDEGGDESDGGGHRGGEVFGAGVRRAEGTPASPVPGADPGGDR